MCLMLLSPRHLAGQAAWPPLKIEGASGVQYIGSDDWGDIWAVNFAVKNPGTGSTWVVAYDNCGPFDAYVEWLEEEVCPQAVYGSSNGYTGITVGAGQTATVPVKIWVPWGANMTATVG